MNVKRNFDKDGVCDVHGSKLKPLLSSYFCADCDNNVPGPYVSPIIGDLRWIPVNITTIGGPATPVTMQKSSVASGLTISGSTYGTILSGTVPPSNITLVEQVLTQKLAMWRKPYVNIVNYNPNVSHVMTSSAVNPDGTHSWTPRAIGAKDFDIVEIYLLATVATLSPNRLAVPVFSMCDNAGLSHDELDSFIYGFDDVAGANVHDWNCFYAGANLRKLR